MTQIGLDRAAAATAALSAWAAPIALRDRTSEGAWITVLLSPLHVPARAEVVGRVRALIGLGPEARLGRRRAGLTWRYDPAGLDEQAERIVTTTTDPLLSLAAAPTLRSLVDPELPFGVLLGRTRAAIVIDHRLGDGFLAVLLTAAVLGGGAMPQSLVAASDHDPLPPALRITFAADRGRTIAMLRDRLLVGRVAPASAATMAVPAAPEPATVAGELSAQRTAELQRWAKGRMSLSVVLLHAMREALARCGVASADSGSVLVDLRRYLPSGVSALGNFVTGLPVALAAGPDETAASLTRMLRTGRPLAAHAAGLAARSVREHLGRSRQRDGDAAGEVAPSGRGAAASAVARLTISDMGFVRPLDRLPWDDALGEAAIAVSVDAAGRDGMTVLSHVLRRRLNVSITFDAAVFDPAEVARACRLLCDDPLALVGPAAA